MIMYGMEDCPDCREAEKRLIDDGAEFEYRQIGKKVIWMKKFLKLRDHEACFDEVRKKGKIGIPCFVLPSGGVCLSLEDALSEREI